MIRRDAFEPLAPSLSSQGFKILLDLLATARGSLRTLELPSVFRERQHGTSKLDSKVALDFAALVVAKLTNDVISARFMLFCLVGLTGLAVHLEHFAGAAGGGAVVRRGAGLRHHCRHRLEFRAQ